MKLPYAVNNLIFLIIAFLHGYFLYFSHKIDLPEVVTDQSNLTFIDLSHYSQESQEVDLKEDESLEPEKEPDPEPKLEAEPEPVTNKAPDVYEEKPIVEPKKEQPLKKVVKPKKKNKNQHQTQKNNQNASSVILPEHRASYLNNKPPIYPQASRARNESGTVTLSVTVDVNGNAANVTVIKSSGYKRLDTSALNAVKKYKFKPAMMGGKPINYTYNVDINFKLNK